MQATAERSEGRKVQHAFAAIDLGTHNCRLLVAVPAGSGFRVIDSFSRIVRLGEGVGQTGALSEAAIARTVAALKICARRLGRHGPVTLRAVATEACRRAKNADTLLARVEADAGLHLEIVSEEEEARLMALGCAPLLGHGYEGALVFDIGGGSTEIVWLKRAAHAIETVFATSLPVGVVNLTEAHRDYAAILAEVAPLFARVAQDMTRAAGEFSLATHHLLGTSGTVTTLAGLALGLERYERRRIDGSWHERPTLVRIAENLVAMPVEERAKLGCIGPQRADLMAAGCALFMAIQAHWPCAKLRVADRGLRDGILRELIKTAS